MFSFAATVVYEVLITLTFGVYLVNMHAIFCPVRVVFSFRATPAAARIKYFLSLIQHLYLLLFGFYWFLFPWLFVFSS